MQERNRDDASQLSALVVRYEASTKEGEVLFLGEDSFLELIAFYQKEQKSSVALQVVNQALSRYPFSVDFYLRKAEILIDLGQENKALTILEQAYAFAPDLLEISLLKAETLTYLDRKDEALSLLNTCKAGTPPKALSEIYVLESMVYEYTQAYDLMFTVLKKAIRCNPKNEEALERLWLAVELTRKYKESILLHEEIIDRQPYAYIAWYNLGHAHAYLGAYEKAIDAYEFSFAIKPTFEYAYRDCADLCFETKNYTKALKYYLEIIDASETEGDLFQKVGECYLAMQDYKKAGKYFRQTLRLDPLNDEVYYHYGLTNTKENKWKEAARLLTKAIDIENRRGEYYIALSDVQFQLEIYDAAENNYRKAIEIDAEESNYWLKYASFLIALNRIEEAEALLAQSMIVADVSTLQFGHIACLFKLGRRQEANQRLWEALEEDFYFHEIMFELIPELASDTKIKSIISAYTS